MITGKEARQAVNTLISYCKGKEMCDCNKDDCAVWGFCYENADKLFDECTKYEEGEKMSKTNDAVNHPQHYCHGGIETIDILKAKMPRPWFLGFLKGNVLKYITRSEFKGSEIEDFKKAAWYLDRLITEFEKDKEA